MKFFEKINKLNKLDFITIFGNVFEKNAWIAEKVYDLKPFKNFNDLQAKMMDQYNNCNDEKILEILNDELNHSRELHNAMEMIK